jgi:threonine/homoserine/homoserine lactone efflux protein
MPGPVVTAAIVKGAEHRHAGAWIAVGHMIIEIPLILGLAAGLSYIFDNLFARIIIGVVGGILLIYIGIRMFKLRGDTEVTKRAFPMHPILAGILTTVTNPYFILWWATIGALLVLEAIRFELLGIILFILVHESCDLGWEWFVSYITNKSKKLWTEKTHAYVFGICGIFLVALGVYFVFAFWLG